MKRISFLLKLFFVLLISITVNVYADPPTRVMRLSDIEGTVTFKPAGINEWAPAVLNRPMTTHDQLWSDANSKAELQLGASVFRIGANTNLNILNVDDKIAQMSLTQGTLYLRIWKISNDREVEIDTPNLAFTVKNPGIYRIDVDPNNQTTKISSIEGTADVYGSNASKSLQIKAGESYQFNGTDLNHSSTTAVKDNFDKWNMERDKPEDAAVANTIVSPEVTGSADLLSYGTWQPDATYNQVWFPKNVPSDWVPFRDGKWTWIAPWGWSWVDNEVWGFAPFHYGRWVHLDQGWGWIPGPIDAEPIYMPALVAFLGAKSSTEGNAANAETAVSNQANNQEATQNNAENATAPNENTQSNGDNTAATNNNENAANNTNNSTDNSNSGKSQGSQANNSSNKSSSSAGSGGGSSGNASSGGGGGYYGGGDGGDVIPGDVFGPDFGFGGGIAWFPLGPGDIFVPFYPVNIGYFTNININNTIINQTIVINQFNNPNINIRFRNMAIPGAVTAVPKNTFVNSLPVAPKAVTLPATSLNKVAPVHTPLVPPIKTSVLGTSKAATTKPPANINSKNVITKATPPTAPTKFSTPKGSLNKQPGTIAKPPTTTSPVVKHHTPENTNLSTPVGNKAGSPVKHPPTVNKTGTGTGTMVNHPPVNKPGTTGKHPPTVNKTGTGTGTTVNHPPVVNKPGTTGKHPPTVNKTGTGTGTTVNHPPVINKPGTTGKHPPTVNKTGTGTGTMVNHPPVINKPGTTGKHPPTVNKTGTGTGTGTGTMVNHPPVINKPGTTGKHTPTVNKKGTNVTPNSPVNKKGANVKPAPSGNKSVNKKVTNVKPVTPINKKVTNVKPAPVVNKKAPAVKPASVKQPQQPHAH